MPPLAYFLTWTCYGTWLHGDDRGSVEDPHNRYARPYLAPNPGWSTAESRLLKSPPVTLDTAMRRVVRDAALEHLAFKECTLVALNVRTTHTHLVIRSKSCEPGRLAGSFKAWSTRRLRDAGLLAPDAKVWTARSSTRYLWFEGAVQGARKYVLDEQGPRDEFAVAGTECLE